MENMSDWLNAGVAALALLVALWSLVVAKRAESRQNLNDFYERRRQNLFRIMETRILYERAASLDAEARYLHSRLSSSSRDPGSTSAILPDDTDPNRVALGKLELMLRHLRPDTPVRVLEDAAADVEKMYLISEEHVRGATETLAIVKKQLALGEVG
jgi:hypothetical protein